MLAKWSTRPSPRWSRDTPPEESNTLATVVHLFYDGGIAAAGGKYNVDDGLIAKYEALHRLLREIDPAAVHRVVREKLLPAAGKFVRTIAENCRDLCAHVDERRGVLGSERPG